MKRQLWFVAAAVVFVAAHTVPAAGQVLALPAGDFAYTGDKGPAFWGEASPACAPTSVRQSPIDLDNVVMDAKLEPLRVTSTPTATRVSNPGYTLIGNADVRPTLELGHVTYTLVEFHFHSLSEHTVQGQYGAMELHVVFADPSLQNLAVIGVIYKAGKSSRFLQKMLSAGLPEKSTSAPVTVQGLDVADAFTDTASYYNYPGSLTTPPCSETVNWFVLKRWAEASDEQLEAFRKVLGNDFRPLQTRNGRVVKATPRGPF
jgi:carbonic anhydrase